MRKFLCTVFIFVCMASTANAFDTLILVRHSEKTERWPKDKAVSSMQTLSEIGSQRARSLVGYLEDIVVGEKLVNIYCSPTTRSVSTALPASLSFNAEIHIENATIDEEQMVAFIESLRNNAQSGAVLIVGHSNTIPQLLAASGLAPECESALGVVQESWGKAVEGYDAIWMLDLQASGCDSAEMLPFSLDKR